MKATEIIEKCWNYDFDYEKEDGIISYISYSSEVGIDYDIQKNTINIYRFFSYCDDSDSEDESDLFSHVMEIAFQIFIQHNTLIKWKNIGDWPVMCPGGNNLIGFFDVECSEEIINEFMQLNERFENTISSFEVALQYVIDEYQEKLDNPCGRRFGSKICAGRINLDDRNSVQRPYVGVDYCLIDTKEGVYYCNRREYETLLEILEEVNYSECKFYLYNSDTIVIQGDCCFGEIKVYYLNGDSGIAAVEEAFILQRINTFKPYASERLKGFSEYYLRKIPSVVGRDKNIPLVITEGMTDWQYIEWAWGKIQKNAELSQKYKKVRFELYRYVSQNYKGRLDYPKMQMDCNSLLEMCRSYSHMELGGTFIFISDRDVNVITQQMSENNSYKKWGNGVYSFVLPIPDSRKETEAICIEHYFTDEELKTEKVFSNGKVKRLYLSSEFDKYGRAPSINRFCTNRSACDSTKVKILDGSGSDKIISLTDLGDDTNYGLSKNVFAESVISDVGFAHLEYKNFLLIFDMIKLICEDIDKKENL